MRLRIAIAVGVLAILPFYQNCSRGGGQSVKFESSSQNTSGNGQPYDGKPDPGDYYRVVPGYTCGNSKTPSLAGKIKVTTSDIESVTINSSDCSQTRENLAFADVQSSPLNRATLGFRDGMFEAAKAAPDPVAAPFAETHCRSTANGANAFEVMIHNSQGALSASFKNSAGANIPFTPAGSATGTNYRYTASGITLDLSLRIQGLEAGQVRGFLTHPSVAGEVSCRTIHNPPAPTGGYMVLTAATTQGNFGGLAGANTFCLNQMLTTDFKGKANVVLDAAHVFAFLCDRTTCNNLTPNQSYTYASGGDIASGGRSFVTDASGRGPGGQYAWTGPDVFGRNVYVWANRDTGTPDTWATVPDTSTVACTDWTNNTAFQTGAVGRIDVANSARWSNGGQQCNENNAMICVVQAP